MVTHATLGLLYGPATLQNQVSMYTDKYSYTASLPYYSGILSKELWLLLLKSVQVIHLIASFNKTKI